MRAGFYVTLLLVSQVVVTVLVLATVDHRATANDPGPVVTPCTGDVNGDCALDISDPIYLLTYLLNDGPPPVCCAEGPALTADQITLLCAILPHLSLEQIDDGQGGLVDTIRVSGANLQIVNGTGVTETTNGTGNLIVSYNESGNPVGDVRTGSHNIVGGAGSSYASFGGLIAGKNNTLNETYASVSGGSENMASGDWSSVGAGRHNTASASWSSVSGGGGAEPPYGNTASGLYASVTGGGGGDGTTPPSSGEAWGNLACGMRSTVAGGRSNTASGVNSVVSGGEWGVASGYASSVGGGSYNLAVEKDTTVGGGENNVAGDDPIENPSQAAAVLGGKFNSAQGHYAVVAGGYSNVASGMAASVSGGLDGLADSDYECLRP